MNIKSSPQISVLLPVFNGKHYLCECIASVLQQSLTDFELVLADDCSTDTSREIIQSFSDPRIRVFYREKNLGLFRNLNQLIKVARAPLIRFLCQDDLLEPDCLLEEVKFFTDHPDIGMSFCKTYRIDQNGNEIGKCVLGDLPEIIEPLLSLQLFFYYGCIPGNLSTVCVRKKCFEDIALFDESFQVSGDYEMWVRICQRENLGVIHKHLIRLRSHVGQLSRSSASGVASVSENRRIRSSLLPLLPREIRSWARIYVNSRQNVLDTHHSIRSLLGGRIGDFLRIIQVMGLCEFAVGILCWLLTMNNHLYRPRPRFMLGRDSQ